MQFVPIIHRSRNLLEDRLEVKRLAAVKAARQVQQRTLPPLLTYPHEAPHRDSPAAGNPAADNPEREGRRSPQQEERRTYCRRVRHLPVLVELRSAVERRKHAQRGTDQQEHIDVEA